MSELTYSRNGDYLIPDLTITEPIRSIGKYGRMRKAYLKEHRRILYNSLLLSEKLYPHLLEIEQTATGASGTDDAGADEIGGRHGEPESLRPDALGGPYEQPQSAGRGKRYWQSLSTAKPFFPPSRNRYSA